MWGQVDMAEKLNFVHRIIPTRVGTSDTNILRTFVPQDHPHACGDKLSVFNRPHLSQGSSPRVWGQEAAQRIKPVGIGIIPTRVGTRYCYYVLYSFVQDHPHACGDKLFLTCVLNQSMGSSPRVWGQASTQGTLSRASRIIPTRVGTSYPNLTKTPCN